jgi:hypothetical protein
MEIIVDIQRDRDGRPTGTVRAAGRTERRSFSGNLEFLALIESLYDPVSAGAGDNSNAERSEQ